MQNILSRLDLLREKLTDTAFLSNQGLSNEVGLYVFAYRPEAEMPVRYFLRSISEESADGQCGFRAISFDLYEILLDICRERRILERIPQMEAQRGGAFTLGGGIMVAPVLFALAAVYGGCFCGTHRLRIKESDRCAAMAAELAKLGVKCEIGDDTMKVYETALRTPTEPIDSHNDHRIVMAMSILLSKVGGEIENAQAVAKSMPDFFDKIKQLGIGVECIEDK